MRKRVRIYNIAQQDVERRKDLSMSAPADRLNNLMNVRDKLLPYKGIKKIVSVRELA